ncbi:AraC family transcriptional regulator [Jiangella alba]|uniref:AraC-type DNA-binding protein n=1 Tax=Jiangella alba TaxID=561176 RepID=A0A1H5Q0E9_9ACTN|nr:AraC family transcriptional regulator [Jiangella alba]SEF18918.1 AraC-type DNA-binding protein [Jiangella alba]
MPVAYEHLEPLYPLGWRYFRFKSPVLPPRMHAHPEFELVQIVSGVGTRLIGDSIEEYQPGDLVLIGPQLAHTYASIPDGGMSEAIVVHFAKSFLGETFFDLPAFASVSTMLAASANGLRFTQAPDTLATLGHLAAAEKTVALLHLLVALSRQPYTWLTTGQSSSGADSSSARRIEAIVAHVHEHYRSAITLQDVAGAVHMNASAASRLFARSTGLTLTRYITVVRLNAACRLLRDTDLPIATIASDSGFGNLSNFNRRFRQVKQTTPKEYRVLVRSGRVDMTSREYLPNVKQSQELQFG